MTLHPFISIIIPTKNNEDTIENCMESLRDLKYPKDRYEILIVDGHSKDETVTIAERYGAKIYYEEGGTRAAACNVGLSHVRGDYVAFTDADCIVDKMWLANALKYFGETAVAGVGGPNIVPDDVVSFGKAIDFVLSHTIFSAGATYAKRLGVPMEVESIGGCNSIYQTKVLKEVFPVDEIPTAEDALLNHRIRLRGLRLIDAPDVVVWHYRHWDTPKMFFRRMIAYARGRVQAGRIYREMVKPMHKLAGFSLPVVVLAMVMLFFVCNSIFLAVVGIGIFILLFFSVKCLYETKSLDVALRVPPVILIEWVGWSIGYVKETLLGGRRR
ncbi:MAG: glycosyltransferase [Euryarchaeota archaeon]|nr:glycosyltransferase [Euryarchaeota archaeon]